MKKRMFVDFSMSGPLKDFLKSEGIQIEVLTEGNCDVAALRCDDRKESTVDTIYCGGWIACETARALAEKLDISIMQIGQVLDHLDIKIRKCPLGCFQ